MLDEFVMNHISMKTLVGGTDFSSSLLPSFFIAMLFTFSVVSVLYSKGDKLEIIRGITFPLFMIFVAISVQEKVINKIERSRIYLNDEKEGWEIKKDETSHFLFFSRTEKCNFMTRTKEDGPYGVPKYTAKIVENQRCNTRVARIDCGNLSITECLNKVEAGADNIPFDQGPNVILKIDSIRI